jgi:DnaJ-class molecular chaperone
MSEKDDPRLFRDPEEYYQKFPARTPRELREECEPCQGTGIGTHGDPDTSKCGDCKGRGWNPPRRAT